MQPQEVWDQLVESGLSRASTPGSMRQARCHKLRLRAEPRANYFLEKPRKIELVPPEVREAVRALVSGVAPWPLYLWGKVGTGKSCTALLLLDHAGGFYLTPASLAEALIDAAQGRLTYRDSGRPIQPANIWKEFAETRLVVIDELGTRTQVSDHQYECLKRLLDLREGRPLIAVSNLDLDGVARAYDDRIASRLAAGTVMCFGRDDLRVRRTHER